MPVMWPKPMLIWPLETVTEPRPAKSDEIQCVSVLPSNKIPESGIFPDDPIGGAGWAAAAAEGCVFAAVSDAGDLDWHGQLQPASRSIPDRQAGRSSFKDRMESFMRPLKRMI